MVALEKEIQDLLLSLAPTTAVGKNLSKTKKFLDSSSHMVDSVDQFSKTLQKSLDKGMGGGIAGGLSGWVASKATRVVGGLGAGAVSAILQTAACIIPDSSDPKALDTDAKVAQLIDGQTLPKDKDELFELLQWLCVQVESKHSPFGDSTLESLKKYHLRVYEALKVFGKQDADIIQLAKQYAPKKKFGLF